MYAIVRSGGRQHKVAVGDVIEIDRTTDEPGASLNLSAVLLVDGEKVTSEKDKLAKVSVTAEVVDDTLGPKIRIFKYKNKTGYRRRQGHRQRYTRVKVTDINGTGSAKKATAEKTTAKKTTAKKATAKKVPAKKTTAKATAKKTTAKKTTAKKTTAKKTTAKKATGKKSPAKKSKS